MIMRSLQSSFDQIKKKNQFWGDYTCFAEAVAGRNFSRRRIYTNFIQLVNKDDYDPADVNQLIRHLHQLSKQSVECTFLNKNGSEAFQKVLCDILVA
jgi:hypothetical protein